jgi:Protein of unknown function (DUF3710)
VTEKIFPANRAELGPFDSSEVELPTGFLDFGAVRLVPEPSVGIRLEVEEATGRVVALTLDAADSVIQVSVFAASKHEGIWGDVLAQLTSSIEASGGSAIPYLGQLGPGLDAQVVQADGKLKPIRFIGVDGPRWFIRGSITGAALSEIASGTEIEDIFRSLVIHRGDSPMPPKEPLEIVVPSGIIIPPRPGL